MQAPGVAKVVFLIQMLLKLSAAVAVATFEMHGLKILTLLNFNMLFQLTLTKFVKSELFSCLPKVEHVIKSRKEAIQTFLSPAADAYTD